MQIPSAFAGYNDRELARRERDTERELRWALLDLFASVGEAPRYWEGYLDGVTGAAKNPRADEIWSAIDRQRGRIAALREQLTAIKDERSVREQERKDRRAQR